MATITTEMSEVIRLSKLLEQQAQALDNYKSEKTSHQTSITSLNENISAQNALVSETKAALKAAADLI